MAPSSSPLSTPPTSQPPIKRLKKTIPVQQYRPARALPFELAQHVQIYFEEQLFSQAFSFLTSLLSSSASSFDLRVPTMVPLPAHFAIASTLAIHPVLTTRTTSKEKWDQANAALRLIRLANEITGPINSDFYDAFAFQRYNYGTFRNGGRKVNGDASDDASTTQRINSPYADAESIWARAEDFWHVVGWALNCSCLPDSSMHVARWTRWFLWLESMLQILEDDWELRFASHSPDEALFWQYVELASGGHGKIRRIMRAIFANGGTKSLNEFKEVFRNELKEPTKDADKLKKREVNVNVDSEIYGDYMGKDDDDLSSDTNATTTSHRTKRKRTPSSRRVTPRNSSSSLHSTYSGMDEDTNHPTSASSLGPPQSLTIRLRLLHLLSHISGSIPESFIELSELYTLFVEFIKPLPLPIFTTIILPNTHLDVFSPDAHTTLCEYILQQMLERAAPTVREARYLTQKKMEEAYLEWAAAKNDTVSQCKVSLCMESLMRRLARSGNLVRTKALVRALGAGVQRRNERIGEGRRRKAGPNAESGEDEAEKCLFESGERMGAVVRNLT